MSTPDSDLLRRLLFILHRGWIEARLLAGNQNSQQLFDLADTLEIIPAALSRWKDNDLKVIRAALETYKTRYPDTTFNYIDYLETLQPPNF